MDAMEPLLRDSFVEPESAQDGHYVQAQMSEQDAREQVRNSFAEPRQDEVRESVRDAWVQVHDAQGSVRDSFVVLGQDAREQAQDVRALRLDGPARPVAVRAVRFFAVLGWIVVGRTRQNWMHSEEQRKSLK